MAIDASENREHWLALMVAALAPYFNKAGFPLPGGIRVSCGWPSKGALSAKARRIGEAWTAEASADGSRETFISPFVADGVDVAAVLVHELCHHAVGTETSASGKDIMHGPLFKELATAMGLTGPMRATVPTNELRTLLKAIVAELGDYPHAQLAPVMKVRTAGARLMKVACTVCPCIVRMSEKCIKFPGVPTCACGGAMAVDSGSAGKRKRYVKMVVTERIEPAAV